MHRNSRKFWRTPRQRKWKRKEKSAARPLLAVIGCGARTKQRGARPQAPGDRHEYQESTHYAKPHQTDLMTCKHRGGARDARTPKPNVVRIIVSRPTTTVPAAKKRGRQPHPKPQVHPLRKPPPPLPSHLNPLLLLQRLLDHAHLVIRLEAVLLLRSAKAENKKQKTRKSENKLEKMRSPCSIDQNTPIDQHTPTDWSTTTLEYPWTPYDHGEYTHIHRKVCITGTSRMYGWRAIRTHSDTSLNYSRSVETTT